MRWPWTRGNPATAPGTITRLSEYDGGADVVVWATQLDSKHTATEARRTVSEWEQFFSSGPSPIRRLRFVSRTPKRLFESLRGQTQLEALSVKWGDYSDLSSLAVMSHLRTLHLKGASCVEDLSPIAGLEAVEDLVVEGLRLARDLSPIGDMGAVTTLEVGGDWMSPRVAHVDSFSFLRKMPQLRSVLLHTVAADDLDYSALLDLPNLTSLRVMEVRGMQPSIDVLKAQTPWSE